MRRELIAAMLALLLGCNPVFAQVGGMGSPTPGIGATSPLGITPNSPMSPVGIPMGATELASPGLSPAPTGTLGLTGGGTTCQALGGLSSETSATSSTYDGGGMAIGSGSSLSGGTATCGTASSSSAPSTTATSPPSAGGATKTGIPLDSVEIGNAGISPLVVVPTPSPYSSITENPSMIGSGTPCSMTGSSMSSTGC